jgi:hypothetical protein
LFRHDEGYEVCNKHGQWMNINLSYFGRSLAVQKLKASANHCIDSFVEATSLRKSFEGPATF